MNLWIVMCAAQFGGRQPSVYRPSESWFTDSAEDAEEFARRLIRDGREYVTIHTANPLADYGQRVRLVVEVDT